MSEAPATEPEFLGMISLTTLPTEGMRIPLILGGMVKVEAITPDPGTETAGQVTVRRMVTSQVVDPFGPPYLARYEVTTTA
ncbi:hypothetical protein GCM10022237_39470 [Nocardioides ginsengisoli]|uniref:DUF35 domain-containing protein n=1 Tax=Streptomyces plumbiresistens TaxID=511811 RepID=A0ABP7U2S3_9ACTN